MIDTGKSVLFMLACIHFLLGGCTWEKNDVVQLRHYHLDSTDGIITRSNISLEKTFPATGMVHYLSLPGSRLR